MTLSLTHAARKRAVSLIEGVLYLVVALSVIVGGIVFFNQASESSRVKDASALMTSLSQQMIKVVADTNKTAYIDSVSALPFTWCGYEDVVTKSGYVPANFIGALEVPGTPETQSVNPFTGQTVTQPATPGYSIPYITTGWGSGLFVEEVAATENGSRIPALSMRLSDISAAACNRLGVVNEGGEGPLGSSIISVRIEDNGTQDFTSYSSGTILYQGTPGVATSAADLANACADDVDLIVDYAVVSKPASTTVPSSRSYEMCAGVL